VPANTDDSPSKDVWLESGWLERPIAADQLYDLVQDPNELVNLAGDPRCAEVLADLRARLEQWMRETNDPLLDGPVPPPAGAEYNLPDQLSAAEPTHIFDPRRDGQQ
jgi:N-sulfoglucosamine sulfohydrolase